MTDYLHEKTALLPRVEIRDIRSVIGKTTEHAMRIGAVHGYRGLITGLIDELRRELAARKLPVVATGGTERDSSRGNALKSPPCGPCSRSKGSGSLPAHAS